MVRIPPPVSPPLAPPVLSAAARLHWRSTRRLTLALLAVWFFVGFGLTWFARDLDFDFFGWPFSFWVAAQGAGLVFIALIAAYASHMRDLDWALHVKTLAQAQAAHQAQAAEEARMSGEDAAPARLERRA